MKRILATVLGVLMLAGVASAQTYEAALVAKERAAIDSIAASCDSIATLMDSIAASTVYLRAPTPVAVSWSTLASGITLRDSTGLWWKGTRTFPLTAGASVDGAKAILLEFTWTTWKSGGVNAFTLWNVFSGSATDTTCASHIADSSMADSIDCGDSTGVWKGQNLANVNGTATVLIPIGTGAGHHFIRMTPHSTTMYIYGLNIRARYVW